MRSKIFYVFILICISRALGLVLLPVLLKFSPILLLILSPFLHHLVLTSNLVPPLFFLFVGIVVSLFQCAIGYEFGRRYGEMSFQWCKRHQLLSQKKINLVLDWINFSAPIVLFAIPGPLIAMVTGVSNLRRKLFYFFMIPSQILWVSICLILGNLLEHYLSIIKAFLFDHWPIVTITFITMKFLHRRYVIRPYLHDVKIINKMH
jgi:membrane protein DedA with SNARE-associated domain